MPDSITQVKDLPVLLLRDVVVFPNMVIPLFVGRKKSIKAVEVAMEHDKEIFLATQKSSSTDDPNEDNLYNIGTVAHILQLLRLPDGTIKVLVEGQKRGSAKKYHINEDMIIANVELIEPSTLLIPDADKLIHALISQFDQHVKMNRKIPSEILSTLVGITDPNRLADTIAAHLMLRIEEKQKLLEMVNLPERIEALLGFMEGQMDVIEIENRLRGKVKRQMEKNQRDYYLNEQMKAIQKELGKGESAPSDMDEIEKKIEKIGLSKEAKAKAKSEFQKLKMMSPMSAEATVSRNYLDWILSLPWKKRTKIHYDLIKAKKTLDDDHYGLEEVKERILEYLAVQQRVEKLKGSILCLVGPPGVGKTSLGQSVARAIGRKFARISLGGIRDEAEIRGHRRTYIGSMPGKIIQRLAKVEVGNPLFMLDEIDKMATDFRGDPSSALLEVLDPEQNHTFNDHYLEVDYDLSDVMFISTSNSMNIPPPLLDRMEVIRLPGYTEDEKANIAIGYLIPKQIKQNGLKEDEINFTEAAVKEIVRYYTREAGVRNLEREISKICRKVVKALSIKPRTTTTRIVPRNLDKYLGVKRFRFGIADEKNQIGQVNGLAWTEVGGELLRIEAAAIPGKGNAIYTGQLGEVMQESIKAAMTVVRSRAKILGIPAKFFEKHDIHVHVPEGATPKDGPSAGIGMCTALVSTMTKVPVLANIAMTGEITLRGEVLPIGGLKEKLLAALRAGITEVIIPEENRRDLKEIKKDLKQGLTVHTVKWIDEVLALAFQSLPQSIIADDESEATKDSQILAAKPSETRDRAH